MCRWGVGTTLALIPTPGPVRCGSGDDWVNETIAVPGSEVFLDNPAYIDSAKTFYNAEIVEPHSVYVNQMMAHSASGGRPTPTTPRFAGRDRTNTPMWLLRAMLWSGLFEDLSFPQATAIWWLNDVDGGGIRYWPYGPDQPPEEHVGNMANTALMGDNHGMFHQVNAIGPFDIGTPPSHPDGRVGPPQVAPTGDWVVTDHGEEVYRTPLADIRISVLWKAGRVHRCRPQEPPGIQSPQPRRHRGPASTPIWKNGGVELRFDPSRIRRRPPTTPPRSASTTPRPAPWTRLPSVFDY